MPAQPPLSRGPCELVTKGWEPGGTVAVYLAVDQEPRRMSGEPPAGWRPALTQGVAADDGTLTVTVAANTPLLAYGPRANLRESRWVQTCAHPPWQVKQLRPTYSSFGGNF